MNRRGFFKAGLAGILLAAAPPAFVRRESLGLLVPRRLVVDDKIIIAAEGMLNYGFGQNFEWVPIAPYKPPTEEEFDRYIELLTRRT